MSAAYHSYEMSYVMALFQALGLRMPRSYCITHFILDVWEADIFELDCQWYGGPRRLNGISKASKEDSNHSPHQWKQSQPSKTTQFPNFLSEYKKWVQRRSVLSIMKHLLRCHYLRSVQNLFKRLGQNRVCVFFRFFRLICLFLNAAALLTNEGEANIWVVWGAVLAP